MKSLLLASILFGIACVSPDAKGDQREAGGGVDKASHVIPLLVLEKGLFSVEDPDVRDLASVLGIKVIQEAERNPVCCVWVGSLPPSVSVAPGAYILSHAEDTLIMINDREALRRLVKDIKEKLLIDGKLSKGVFHN